MFSLDTLLVFLVAALSVNLSPGPSGVYVTTIAASQGFFAGLLSVLGMSLGIMIHVLFAASGLAVLLAASETAFWVIKLVGAAYLIYLGISILRGPSSSSTQSSSAVETDPPRRSSRIVLQGVLVDLFNPKIALFFVAFLPQFLSAEKTSFFGIVLLGCVFVATGAVVNSGFAWLAAMGAKRARNSRIQVWVRRWVPGAVLVVLGARLAWP